MSSEIPSDVTIPPPEVRESIEKIASYVNKNGPQFEIRIGQNRSKDIENKFQFLNNDDPYNGYYRWHLNKLKSGGVKSNSSTNGHNSVSNEVNIEESIKEPKEFIYLTDDIPRLSSLDLNMIKITAQLVAVNGDGYLKSLRRHCKKDKERSIQFEFLNAKHSMHPIFARYLSTYQTIISSKQKLIEDLSKPFNSIELLDNCFNRAEYTYIKETERAKKEDLEEKLRIEFASINWQDFVVLETIEFTESDDVSELELPMNKSDLEVRSLLQKKANSLITETAHEEEEEEEEPDYDDEDDESMPSYNTKSTSVDIATTQTGTGLKVPKGMKIRAQGESRLQHLRQGGAGYTSNGERMLKCPLTHRLIPESQFQQHISILLRDPKYKEEKRRYEARFRYGSNLSVDQVYENVKRLTEESDDRDAKRRRY